MTNAQVTFFTRVSSDEQNMIRDTVSKLVADYEQVTITIYYAYSLPVGNLGEFTQIYLKASCTMKRG